MLKRFLQVIILLAQLTESIGIIVVTVIGILERICIIKVIEINRIVVIIVIVTIAMENSRDIEHANREEVLETREV